jgi:hypothetical protein
MVRRWYDLSKNARIAGLLYIVASVVGFVRLGYIPKALFVLDIGRLLTERGFSCSQNGEARPPHKPPLQS